MKRVLRGAALLIAAAMTLSACGGQSGKDPLQKPADTAKAAPGKVVVGSANFPENVLLASIYSQALQAKGVQVEEKFNIGTRENYYDQVKSGALTVLPEYNGALLAYIDKTATATSKDEVNTALKSKLPAELEILESSAAEDKDSLTVTKATAAKHNLKSIADLAKVSKDFVVGGPPEFKQRREAQFKDAYGLTFKSWKPTGDATPDALKSDEIQAGNVFTTDPKIIANDLVSLEDPKNVFSSQNITPLVHKAGANDTLRTTLNAVSAKLDTQQLVDMMRRIAIDKEDPPAVAKDWLTKSGLL
ncbi:ABC transporter substrate-binding protein [Bailinhaonella thermotolerans]|uniref:ABC transporter substrate-binding protein n=1 Tax=Bailinhaonella thermotolerans TaxID=1070861 RepID=A0A3A4AEH0_9ACTN|nr:ABC transporter substrate-binding protein [Bailinhaonella thermotolerans]RJL25124.1 ABC transporter substrate-binding protein [Bailinhaonella thermotolerans]